MAGEHRAIVVVDVASFTDPARTLSHQRTVHEGMYGMLRAAFAESGIGWENCYVEDRGDGAMILVPPRFPKLWLADQWPARLLSALREYNAVHAEQARVQLRVALHHGEVYTNDDGVVSQAVNLAFRILDAQPAKSALAASGGMLALIASNEFYHDVVAQEPAADAGSYRRIAVSVKQTETVAWLRLPDAPPSNSQPNSQPNSQLPAPVQPTPPRIPPSPVVQAADIVNALLELPFIRDANGRAILIDLLRSDIATTVPYHANARLHVHALVQTCLRHEHGLLELIEAVRQLDGDSVTGRRLAEIQRMLLPDSVD